ncbi:hypothetical protein ACLB2K_040201 [Fragaria x ananassa]
MPWFYSSQYSFSSTLKALSHPFLLLLLLPPLLCNSRGSLPESELERMYSAMHSLPLDGGVCGHGEFSGSLDGTNLPGDACLVLTTDPKPRLRWTAELHERFVDAVTQLGGPDIMIMSHKTHNAFVNFGVGSIGVLMISNQGVKRYNTETYPDTGSSATSSRVIAQDLNDGFQVTEALRVQMEVQRRLHEQLEVQRHLQLRIEAQGKYLQSILEKACKALNDQAATAAGLEAAKEELSELAIKVSSDCQGMAPLDTIKMPSLSEIAAAIENQSVPNILARMGNCSVDSCLTSTGSPGSPMGMSSLAVRKRQRPFFGNGESLPLDGNMRQEVEWMMNNIG